MDYEKIAKLLFPFEEDRAFYEKKYPKRNLKEHAMVTRFAPSPTGFVHLGSLYTAYIAFLMAKQSGGVCYLRIEDTDQNRLVANGTKKIISDLEDYGISFQESPTKKGLYAPYIQSDRKQIYAAFAKDLVLKGLAYPCFYTKEDLSLLRQRQEQKKERLGVYGKHAIYRSLSFEEVKERVSNGEAYVIRLKSKGNFENKILLKDEIKGSISFPENDMDAVLIKEDGFPTYHFAHIIDDYLMGTTHVIRGDEWLSTYPLHMEIASFLQIKPCHYAHISPITIKENGSIRKLSKRLDKESSLSYYKELGIPKEVILLYLETLMNPNFESYYQQFQSAEGFLLDFKKMPVGGTLYDIDKLLNISRSFFSKLSALELYERTLSYAKEYDPTFANTLESEREYAISVFSIERNKAKPRKDIATYADVKHLNWYFFDSYFEQGKEEFETLDSYDEELICRYFKDIYDINDSEEVWYEKLKDFANQNGYAKSVKEFDSATMKGHIGTVCQMIRVTLTGCTKTPNLYEILKVMGLNRILKRAIDFEK